MAVLAKVESKSQSPKVENMFSKLNLSETFFLPHLNFPIYRLTETCDSTSAIETETWILPLRYGVYTFGFSELVLLKATSLGPEPVWTFLQDRGTCTVMSTWQYLMLVRNFQYLDEFTVETLIGGRVYFVINWYFNGQIIFF